MTFVLFIWSWLYFLNLDVIWMMEVVYSTMVIFITASSLYLSLENLRNFKCLPYLFHNITISISKLYIIWRYVAGGKSILYCRPCCLITKKKRKQQLHTARCALIESERERECKSAGVVQRKPWKKIICLALFVIKIQCVVNTNIYLLCDTK